MADQPEDLNNAPVKRTRRAPINGGTWICSRCKERRISNSAYCREHHNAYHSDYARKRLDKLKRLEQLLTKI